MFLFLLGAEVTTVFPTIYSSDNKTVTTDTGDDDDDDENPPTPPRGSY